MSWPFPQFCADPVAPLPPGPPFQNPRLIGEAGWSWTAEPVQSKGIGSAPWGPSLGPHSRDPSWMHMGLATSQLLDGLRKEGGKSGITCRGQPLGPLLVSSPGVAPGPVSPRKNLMNILECLLSSQECWLEIKGPALHG